MTSTPRRGTQGRKAWFLHGPVQRDAPGLFRALRLHPRGDCPREGDQADAARTEDCVNRVDERAVAGFERRVKEGRKRIGILREARVEFVSLLGKSLKAAQIHEHFRPQFFSQTNKITGSSRRMMRWTQPAFKRRQCASDGNVTIENELREGPLCRLHESGWISQSRFSICTE